MAGRKKNDSRVCVHAVTEVRLCLWEKLGGLKKEGLDFYLLAHLVCTIAFVLQFVEGLSS
jgi:hypothetical protein